MRVPTVLALALVVATLVAAPSSFAQSASAGSAGRPEARRTIIDMDLEVIEGGLHRPDHEIVRAPVKRGFRNLIQIRKEFRREVLVSAGQL